MELEKSKEIFKYCVTLGLRDRDIEYLFENIRYKYWWHYPYEQKTAKEIVDYYIKEYDITPVTQFITSKKCPHCKTKNDITNEHFIFHADFNPVSASTFEVVCIMCDKMFWIYKSKAVRNKPNEK